MSQNVYQVLKSEILECRLLPNSDLREQHLAHRFAVSKSPVREALLRLEQERLVTVAPRQGYKVAPISLEDAREMFELRKVLESACAETAASTGTKESLSMLDAFRTLDHAGGDAPTDAFIKYNREFHIAVCESSGNSRMARLATDLIEQMERMIRYSVDAMPAQNKSVLLQEHGEIIDAIQGGDRRKASRLIKHHISDAEKRVVNHLSQAAIHR
ncbi:GntR family transcriptional regulator [Castellaniella sp. GW247-6E4]|uniref:GntR family transcriptional regulator n=1 Tax=Castellaniella sp. GW247-6E4 TaxID=3140380 RepID=UPI003314CB25